MSNEINVLAAAAAPTVDEKIDLQHVEDAAVKREAVLETKLAKYTRWEALRIYWKAVMFGCMCNWAALNDGFQNQLPGNIIANQGFIDTMANTVTGGVPAISAYTISLWGGIGAMAQTIGQFAGASSSDYIGRKGTMACFTVLFLAASFMEVFSTNWKLWLGGKVLSQLALGMAISTIVTYLSEITPFQLRGTMMGAYQFFFGFGQFFGSIATQVLSITDPTKWRPALASEFIFTGFFMIFLIFLPESPYYYAKKKDAVNAKKMLQKLYGGIEGYDIDYEYRVIEQALEAEEALHHEQSRSDWAEIFRGSNLRRTVAGVLGIIAQPLSGGPVFWSYSSYFFTVSGFQHPFLITVIIFLLLIVAVAIALVCCETVGRRTLLLWGNIAMLFFNIGIAVTGSFTTTGSSRASLAFVILWVLAYGLSVAPIGFAASGETSTPRLRAKTTSFNLGVFAAVYLVFQWTVPYMIATDAANLGVKALYIFAGFLVPTIIALYFFYPETSGRTYQELDELFERKVPARKFKSTQTSVEAANLKNTGLITH